MLAPLCNRAANAQWREIPRCPSRQGLGAVNGVDSAGNPGVGLGSL
jgi:hypothetical protein